MGGKVAMAVSHHGDRMTINIMSSSDGPQEHTGEERDIKSCKYLTQNTNGKSETLEVVLKKYRSPIAIGHI